jgi:hypothetical protein
MIETVSSGGSFDLLQFFRQSEAARFGQDTPIWKNDSRYTAIAPVEFLDEFFGGGVLINIHIQVIDLLLCENPARLAAIAAPNYAIQDNL